MENSEKIVSTKPVTTAARVPDPLRAAFEPVTLRRPMTLFRSTLGLNRNVAAAPETEFLLCLITGHVSEKAMLRDALGENFKNLENFLWGRNTTQKVFERLRAAFGIDASDFRALVHGRKERLLLPQLVDGFLMLEGTANSCFSTFTARPVPCPYCKADLMVDADAWWNRQGVQLRSPERRFVDRLLTALVGASLFGVTLMPGSEPFEATLLLSDPKKHPIGNWLKWLQHQCECTDLDQLHGRLTKGREGCVSGRKLEKYSSGQDLMPVRAAEQLIATASDHAVARTLLIAARTLALTVDFVCAAAEESGVSRKTAQTVIHLRLQALHEKIGLALGAASGSVLRAVAPPLLATEFAPG
jgi:hypothetical protein